MGLLCSLCVISWVLIPVGYQAATEPPRQSRKCCTAQASPAKRHHTPKYLRFVPILLRSPDPRPSPPHFKPCHACLTTINRLCLFAGILIIAPDDGSEPLPDWHSYGCHLWALLIFIPAAPVDVPYIRAAMRVICSKSWAVFSLSTLLFYTGVLDGGALQYIMGQYSLWSFFASKTRPPLLFFYYQLPT